MKTGDERRIEPSSEQGFGPDEANKKKPVSRTELLAATKEEDVLADRA
jgi:hypothetical protein